LDGSDQLDQALAAVRNGGYNTVITVGSTAPADLYRAEPVPYAELAREYLVRHGLPGSLVTAVHVPESAQDRTYLNAVMIRGWLQRSGRTVDAIDVFSSGVHSRRSRMLYRTAFGPHIRVGILARGPRATIPTPGGPPASARSPCCLRRSAGSGPHCFFTRVRRVRMKRHGAKLSRCQIPWRDLEHDRRERRVGVFRATMQSAAVLGWALASKLPYVDPGYPRPRLHRNPKDDIVDAYYVIDFYNLL